MDSLTDFCLEIDLVIDSHSEKAMEIQMDSSLKKEMD